jgi:hypothetical protein
MGTLAASDTSASRYLYCDKEWVSVSQALPPGFSSLALASSHALGADFMSCLDPSALSHQVRTTLEHTNLTYSFQTMLLNPSSIASISLLFGLVELRW